MHVSLAHESPKSFFHSCAPYAAGCSSRPLSEGLSAFYPSTSVGAVFVFGAVLGVCAVLVFVFALCLFGRDWRVSAEVELSFDGEQVSKAIPLQFYSRFGEPSIWPRDVKDEDQFMEEVSEMVVTVQTLGLQRCHRI